MSRVRVEALLAEKRRSSAPKTCTTCGSVGDWYYSVCRDCYDTVGLVIRSYPSKNLRPQVIIKHLSRFMRGRKGDRKRFLRWCEERWGTPANRHRHKGDKPQART